MAPDYPALKRDAIADQVVRSIVELIRSKQLRPGDKLPAERELAEALGVSRPSLREGIRTLAYMNILSTRHGGGSYVASLAPESLVEHLDMLLSLDDATIFELLEARLLVEPELAAVAAERISPAQLEQVNSCLRAMQASPDQPDLLVALDVELHQLIAEAAGNAFMNRFMASIRHLSQRSRARTIQIDAIRLQAQRDHSLIVAAINAHDAGAARAAMRQHLTQIEQGLRAAAAAEP
ncbi:FadR/GntR family transcriptional regulator [Kouleothrix sp.]|uniref:FadR/GntR family transcriptional regulator n=1 Tax=Kouleothrix sp. TaxID=2779161 RepID=UPI00391CBD53